MGQHKAARGAMVQSIFQPAAVLLQVLESKAELKETTAVLATTSDQLKLCKMELEGANAQLQVCMRVCASAYSTPSLCQSLAASLMLPGQRALHSVCPCFCVSPVMPGWPQSHEAPDGRPGSGAGEVCWTRGCTGR